jgi:hypothetical protein
VPSREVRRLKDLLNSYQVSSASHPSSSAPLRASVSLHRSLDADRDLYSEQPLRRSQLAAESLWYRAMSLADGKSVERQGGGSGQGEGWGPTVGDVSVPDMCYPRQLSSIEVKILDWVATSGVGSEGPTEMEIEMEMELPKVRQENLALRRKVVLLEARQLHEKSKEDSRRRQEAEQENKVSAIE